MKIYFPNCSPDGIGGGFTFYRNLLKCIKSKIQIAHNLEECDIMFISGCTMVQRDEVKKAKELGKKIILRVDNIPEDYRNRGTALSRLKDFSELADVVVYQSEWAKEYVMGFTGVDGTVIYNGVDREVFNMADKKKETNRILYIRSSSNENKRWQEAKYHFRKMWLENKELEFVVVGNFADYIKQYGQEFVDKYRLGMFDEPYSYTPSFVDPYRMASVYKDCDQILIPFYNDACSNVVLEAMACGITIDLCDSGDSGGTTELLELHDDKIGIERMGKDYLGLFNLVLQ